MSTRLDQLRRLLSNFSADGSSWDPWDQLLGQLLGLDEEERASLRATCQRWFESASESDFSDWFPAGNYPFQGLPQLVYLGVAELSDFDRSRVFVGEPGLWFRLLDRRRPAWLREYLESICKAGRPASKVWALARGLIREGLCERPEGDDYIRIMIEGLPPDRDVPLAAALREDPGLLEYEVWRLFEVRGERGDRNLTNRDRWWGTRYVEQKWSHALAELGGEGLLPRPRLLDAGLDALARDIPDHDAQWFTSFHRDLKPTSPERLERAQRYLELLASPSRSTVSFALQMLQAIAGQVESAVLIKAITPLFASSQANHAREAVKLAGKAVEKGSKQDPAAVSLAVAEALLHQSVDVQDASLTFIAGQGTAALAPVKSRLLGYADGLAPSVQARLAALLPEVTRAGTAVREPVGAADDGGLPADVRGWSGLSAVERDLAEGTEVRAVDLESVPLPRLEGLARLSPVADLEQLASLLTRLLEDHSSAEQIELALDGVSRLCDLRPPGFERLTGPLVKRARKLLGPANPFANTWPVEHPEHYGGRVQTEPDGSYSIAIPTNLGYVLCGLVLAWAAGEMPKPLGPRLNLVGFLQARSYEVAVRAAAARAGPLLAAPTHRGGWLDPAALEARRTELALSGRSADPLDSVQADLRAEAKAPASYALGWRVGPPRVQVSEWQWLRDEGLPADAYGERTGIPVHARTMLHCAVEPERPSVGKLDQVLEMFLYPLTWQVDWCRDPRDYVTNENLGWPEYDGGTLRWIATVMPHDLEPYFAKAAILVGDSWDGKLRRNTHLFLEPLLDPDRRLGPSALLLLALSLAAGSAEVSGLATDALIAAVSDGRLDADGLAAALLPVVGTDQLKLTRLATTLGRAPEVSELHSQVARRTLELIVSAVDDPALAGLPACLSLLKELCVAADAGIAHPAARARLEGLAASRSKTGRLATDLLAAKGEGREHARRAARIALADRLARARRWAG